MNERTRARFVTILFETNHKLVIWWNGHERSWIEIGADRSLHGGATLSLCSTFKQGASATRAVESMQVTPSQRPPHGVGAGAAAVTVLFFRTLGAPRLKIKVPLLRVVVVVVLAVDVDAAELLFFPLVSFKCRNTGNRWFDLGKPREVTSSRSFGPTPFGSLHLHCWLFNCVWVFIGKSRLQLQSFLLC